MLKDINEDFESIRQRILKNSVPEPNTGCWLWLGDSVKGGYGRSAVKGRKWLVHRLSYRVFIGEIPDGLTIDHKCKMTCCCNPQHLEAVTMRENVMRGTSISKINAEKTFCSRGHEYTEENTYYYKDGRRECCICMDARNKEYYKNNKEEIKERSRKHYHNNK